MNASKAYTLFAGVNGAGKSTLYKLLNLDFGVRINLDEIIKARFNGYWNDSAIQTEAGRIAVRLIKDCIDNGKSFNQETTLTGLSILTTIKKAKNRGFKINLYYVGLENVELSINRVATRVRAGGHGIPIDVLRRRYEQSFENLKTILPFCDSVSIYDNSGLNAVDALKPLLVIANSRIALWDEKCPQYLKRVLDDFIIN